MGTYGTYCGSLDVRYFCQTQWDQLTEFTDVAEFNNWVEGTLIPKAEGMVNAYCNHAFGTPSFGTMRLDGSGRASLFLPPEYTPLIGIDAGSVDGVGITASDLVCYEQFIRYDGGIFPSGKKNVVLYGSFGYAELPHDIQYVTAQLCANVILDMIRRNMSPELFRQAMLSRQGSDPVPSLWASPNIFSSELKRMLFPYKIAWVDIG